MLITTNSGYFIGDAGGWNNIRTPGEMLRGPPRQKKDAFRSSE